MAVPANNVDLVFIENLSPEGFRDKFPTVDVFKNQLEKGRKSDLEHLLKVYEEEEMYIECLIIQKFIKEKFVNN